ncbi:DUF4234 domain-containing protein [Mediterraneibacter sp.]|jgi:hypothetical protein|uniref:DUF4234 domain-containing protein n=1 Tax=Mediterraneibacter sp. TaxID=2316022 RepID=UPI0015B2B5F0|nr:DUF4234 domain-containing protein [Mediterraneibacter sp.]
MQCKTCGREISDTAKFCPYCGSKTEPSQNTAEKQTTETSYGTEENNPQKTTAADKTEEIQKFLQIGFFILAGVCSVIALNNLISGIQSFSYDSVLQGLGSFLEMACYAGSAVIIAMFAFTKEKEKTRTFFIILCGLTAIIALRGIIGFITSLFRNFRYYFSFYTFFWSLSSLLLTLTAAIAIVGITYILLYLAGMTPDLSNVASSVNGFTRNSQTCGTTQDSQNSNAQSNTTQNGGAQNNGAQNGSAQNNTNYGGQNMGTNYYNQGTNYNNQGSGSNYSGPGVTPLKTDRGLLGYIVLSIITCGIYGYYFIYTVARDVNTACAGDGKTTGGLVQFILLSIVTCGIYSWWWEYSLGNRLAANAPRYGLSFSENGTTILLWLIFGAFLCGIGPFIAMNIIIKNTNSICMAYNRYNGLI